MRITVDGRRFTLTPTGDDTWDLADADGKALGSVKRIKREETRSTVQYHNGRAYSGTIRKVTAVYWRVSLPLGTKGRLLESRAAAVRWLRDPPAWWVAETGPALSRRGGGA